jgi:SET and MYND domain-containing protein
MAPLVSNIGLMEKQDLNKFGKLYRYLLKFALQNGERELAENCCDPLEAEPPGRSTLPRVPVTESMFQVICATMQCNAFGDYDKDDHCTAVALYPLASYFNHSCLPNLTRSREGRNAVFYALRDIKAGEPLVISYVDPLDPPDVRRRHLMSSYRFVCECPRCRGHEPLRMAFCQQCRGRGTLRPKLGSPGEGICNICAAESALVVDVRP